ncbi:YvbH-like oligomerization domain-containing protein [Neobacillus niacini]
MYCVKDFRFVFEKYINN